MNALQKLVADRMAELDLSYRRAADRSGGLISHATLNHLVTGRVTRVSEANLRGIALAINVPLDTVMAAAKAAEPKSPPEFRLPKRANQLSAKERAAVLAMVNALLESHVDKKD